MAEIILVRHGETDWNASEVFRGRIDVALNETGLKQAECLGEYLSGTGIEAVYSSPLKRSLQTAEAIARYQSLEVKVNPGLVDLDFGQWQGLSRQEVQAGQQELYQEWLEHPERVRMPGGESLDDVRQRAMTVVGDVLASHSGTVALVAHRVLNKVLICALLGLDNAHFWNIRQDTCGITRFTHEKGNFILTGHNDTSFLKAIRAATLGDF